MAPISGEKYYYIFGTLKQFEILKLTGRVNPNNLYFITDTNQIYVGEDLYTGQVQFVDSFPQSPSMGIIYVNSVTHETKIWNGNSWQVIVPPISDILDQATVDTNLVTAKAIRDYFKQNKDNVVKNIEYNNYNQAFTVTYTNDSTSTLTLLELLTGVSYNSNTGDFTFTVANGEDIVINTPKENFLQSATYDKVTHILTLTLTDGTEVNVNLEELIDVYAVEDTATIDLILENNIIKANIKKSATEKNALVLNDDGLFVPESLIKAISETNSIKLVLSDEGSLTANVNISANNDNQITINNDGLFVPKADLSNYYTKEEVGLISDSKQNKLTVGEGIIIENDVISANIDESNLVHIDTDETIIGAKTFTQPLKVQNGKGTGSLILGADVNANTLTDGTRKLARVAVPTQTNTSLNAILLGFDSSGDDALNVKNKDHDTVSFGGQTKITNATSPMSISFCVAKTRNATEGTNKIYPLEMDSTEARFNVQPNYNGTNLATISDVETLQEVLNNKADKSEIPTVNDKTLTIQKNGVDVATFTANSNSDVTANILIPTNISEFNNDSGYITKDIDNLTNYTKTTDLPTNLSEFTNDTNFQNATQVNSAIDTHNSSQTAHTDIRNLISDLQSQVDDNAGDIAKLDADKQNVITDLSDIRSNAETGANLTTQVNTNKDNISLLQTNKADKSTTLLGYGITDAYTKTEINSTYETIDNVNQLSTKIDSKQDKLTAGEGITIENNVISVTDDGSSSTVSDNGIKAYYSTRYGIVDAPNGIIDNKKIKSGLSIKIPNVTQKLVVEEDISFVIPTTVGTYTIFLAEDFSKYIIPTEDIVYSVNEPSNPSLNMLWFNPDTNIWQSWVADWSPSNLGPIADIINTKTGTDTFGDDIIETTISYAGYRILDDVLYAKEEDIPDISNLTTREELATKQDKLIAGENISIEDNVISASGGSSYAPPLLSCQWYDHILNDIRWLRGDTFSWQDGGVYFGTYDTLEAEYNNENSVEETDGAITYKRTPSKYKIADVSQEEAILNKYNTDGIAWYYIIDTVNKRFKLPRTKYGFTGIRDGLGNDVEAGLPTHTHTRGTMNITGSACNGYDSDAFGQSGAFYNGRPIANSGFGFDGNSHGTYSASLFDASRSWTGETSEPTNPTYKDGSTVQPPATQMYLYFYVGSYTTDAIENTAGLNAELFNSKLDIDCNNTSATGKDFMSSMGMPSGKYIDLTLGASGTEYIAPANGWYVALLTCNLTQGGMRFQNISKNGFCSPLVRNAFTGGWFATNIPCQKGDVVGFYYDNVVLASSDNYFRFYYTEGAE